MTQTSNRFLDEIARLMNDAAGVASGVRRELDTAFRNQADRILRDLDVVKREEFEAVKEMARIAREENEALKVRLGLVEAEVAKMKAAANTPSAPPVQAPAYGSDPSAGMHPGGSTPPNPDQPSGPTGPGSF